MRHHFLDSLRGIAICGVVMIHVGQSIPGLPGPASAFAEFGLRGVQLFFIVSALTLCLVTNPERFSPANFYTRRFFRVAPMFYVAAVFYLAARAAGLMNFAPDSIYVTDIASTVLFLHGFNPHAINNVVPGGWSIASEAIFYAAFPFVLFQITDLRKAWMLVIGAFAVAFAAGLLGHRIGATPAGREWQNYLHFSFLLNAPAFACGVLLFHCLKTAKQGSRGTGMLVTVATLSLIVIFATFSAKFPADQLLFIPILSALVFIAARYQSKLVVNGALGFLGEISFSLYLVHFAVQHLLLKLVPLHWSPMINLVVLYGLTIGVSSVAAWATYRLVERPMISLGHKVSAQIRPRERRVWAPRPG